MAPLIRREICWSLLCSPLGGGRRRYTKSAERQRHHSHRSGHDLDACELSKVFQSRGADRYAEYKPRVFHRHFKTISQLTQVQFQERVRLQEAWRLLFSEQDVASVDYLVGYESPSQFSRDYHKLFGAPSDRDKAMMRSSLATESGV